MGSRNTRDDRRGLASSALAGVGGRVAALCSSVGSPRLGLVFGLFLLVAAIFFCRLFFLQVVVSDEYASNAYETRERWYPIQARRGTIYDRNGVVLATSVDATTITANPRNVNDASATAKLLAEFLGGEEADYRKLLTQDGTFAYIQRQADKDVAAQLQDKLAELELRGVEFHADMKRVYPNGAVGGQVVGYCDVDGNGVTGLEFQYDEELKGTDGKYHAEQGAYGTPIPGTDSETVAAVDGEDIMISIDIKLQDAAEQALKSDTESMSVEKGNVVVMDASTGEIYAICSMPYMDPTNMAESEVGSDQVTAITQAFEPGSIFKTVSALTVLESKAMTPDDELFCPAEITADGYSISDAHERSDITYTFRDILNNSSNVGISLAMEQVGFDKLHDVIQRLGLNEITGVDYPGESSGLMQDFDNWARITGYNVSFGQGITCTPLQMTRFYAAICNDGVAVTPHFLIARTQTGERPEYAQKTVITDQEVLAQITSMLRTVVQDGTGKAADIEGYEVVGKTSTAEIAGDGGYLKGQYNLCFAGFIDNSSSQLVCFVSANEVYGEGSVANVFHDIMTSAVEQYNIVPE